MITFSPEWLKKNWLKIIIAIAIFIGIIYLDRACKDADYRKDIEGLDKEISELEKKNLKLEDEAFEYVKGARANEKVVADLKTEVAESKSRIKKTEKEEVEVEKVVMELPPSRLVEELQVVLECREILLNEDGILFPVECARQGLLKLKKFSLVENKYDEAIFALGKAEEALHFQERVSWNLYGALWKMGDQILNYKVIVKKQDLKFDLCEKQKRKNFWKGLKTGIIIGIVAGVVITATLKFVIK